jgi:hypothetical protein
MRTIAPLAGSEKCYDLLDRPAVDKTPGPDAYSDCRHKSVERPGRTRPALTLQRQLIAGLVG